MSGPSKGKTQNLLYRMREHRVKMPRSPTPYTKMVNRDRTAASAPAGSPGDLWVCTSFSTRATARARVPSLPPSSHAARFCRSATWG